MAEIKRTSKLAAPKKVTVEDIATYHANQIEIKRLTAENDAIGKRIKAQYEPGNYEASGFLIELIKTVGTLKKDYFMREYPAEEFPELYDLTPSTEAIKEQFGDERDEFYSPVLRLTIKTKGK